MGFIIMVSCGLLLGTMEMVLQLQLMELHG